MNSRRTAFTVFLLIWALCTAHALYYYPKLPDRVAQHFGSSGEPDAWGSKMEFVIIYMATVFFTAGIFLGIGLALPKIPNWAINIPNKDYWLSSPQRRKQTFDSMVPQLLWIGSLTLVYMLDIFHQAFQVQLGRAASLDHGLISTVVYLGLIIIWSVALVRQFSKKNIPNDFEQDSGGDVT